MILLGPCRTDRWLYLLFIFTIFFPFLLLVDAEAAKVWVGAVLPQWQGCQALELHSCASLCKLSPTDKSSSITLLAMNYAQKEWGH